MKTSESKRKINTNFVKFCAVVIQTIVWSAFKFQVKSPLYATYELGSLSFLQQGLWWIRKMLRTTGTSRDITWCQNHDHKISWTMNTMSLMIRSGNKLTHLTSGKPTVLQWYHKDEKKLFSSHDGFHDHSSSWQRQITLI